MYFFLGILEMFEGDYKMVNFCMIWIREIGVIINRVILFVFRG